MRRKFVFSTRTTDPATICFVHSYSPRSEYGTRGHYHLPPLLKGQRAWVSLLFLLRFAPWERFYVSCNGGKFISYIVFDYDCSRNPRRVLD